MKVTTRALPFANCDGTTLPVKFDFFLEYKDPRGNIGAARAGFVVQKVTVKCFIKECSCGPCEIPKDEKEFDTFEYWEAWEVKKGDKSVLDNAYIPTWNRRCGKYVQTGVIKFFCKNRQNVPPGTGDRIGTGSLEDWKPGEFGGKKNRECGTKTGKLPGTDDPKKAAFWDKLPVEGPATRSMETDWNCCDPPKKVAISADPPAP